MSVIFLSEFGPVCSLSPSNSFEKLIALISQGQPVFPPVFIFIDLQRGHNEFLPLLPCFLKLLTGYVLVLFHV